MTYRVHSIPAGSIRVPSRMGRFDYGDSDESRGYVFGVVATIG